MTRMSGTASWCQTNVLIQPNTMFVH